MKKILLILFVFCTVFNVTAQKNLSVSDSIFTFYKELVSTMKAEYLYKEKIDWSETESELNRRLEKYTHFKSSLNEITFLFDRVNAAHCSVNFRGNVYKDSKGGLTASDLSDEWLKKYAKKPQFEVKVLDDQYGYILMPGIDVLNSKKVNKIAQSMYDEIDKIKISKNIKGWIIDLRFNTGGACMPMLLSLYDFLGDNNVWGTLDVNKKQLSKVKLKNGNYIIGSKKEYSLNPNGELLDKATVVIITGIATASSGEVTALGFKGRENTIFVGEKTYGATTSNVIRDLPFGAYMALTMGYDCDRNGIFYAKIIPDIEITDQDNFGNLLLDGNIKEGIKYIEGK